MNQVNTETFIWDYEGAKTPKVDVRYESSSFINNGSAYNYKLVGFAWKDIYLVRYY